MKRTVALILSLVLLTLALPAAHAVPASPLSYAGYYNMHKAADFVCRIKYTQNEVWGHPYEVYDIAAETHPERRRPASSEWAELDSYALTEDEIFDIARSSWPGIADSTLYDLYVSPFLDPSRYSNGYYEITFNGGVGIGYDKDADKGKYQGFTINADGTYSLYYIVTPWEPAEDILTAKEYEECAKIAESEYEFEYKGRVFRMWYWLQVRTDPVVRVFNYRLTDGKAEYISDAFGGKLPENLLGADAITYTGDEVPASGSCGENVTWTFDIFTGTLTVSGAGSMADYGYDKPAPWSDFITLKTVIITSGVTGIGSSAFDGCESLTDVTVADSVTKIGYDAFNNTAWYDARPDGPVYAGKVLYAYKGKCPASVTIKEGTVAIADYVFYLCKDLESVTIPSGVKSIGSRAFSDCTKLTGVTIPSGVTSIGSSAFSFCTSLASITIPDSVTSIGSYAFYNTPWYNNKSNGLIYVGKVAYRYKGSCPSSVTIKDGTVGIADRAFEDCTGLESITIPSSVTNIGDYAFDDCTWIEKITVDPNNTVYYSEGNCIIERKTQMIVLGCRTSVIPDGVTNIGNYAFYKCKYISSIVIPESVTSIGDYAFYDCTGLVNVTIPSGVTSIGNSAFSGCTALVNVTIPYGVTSIGDNAFFNCKKITVITIPDSVVSLETNAFYNCKGISSVTIGKGVKSIGYGAFNECSALKTVYFRGSESEWKNISVGQFNDRLRSATVYYNCCIGSRYHTAGAWQSSDEGHFKVCAVCGDVFDYAAHEPKTTWATDAGTHWHECAVCGYKLQLAAHDYSDGWAHDGTSHWQNCAVCKGRTVLYFHDFDEDGVCAACGYEFVFGDLDGDEKIAAGDAIHLLYHVFFPDDYPVAADYDLTHDGRTDASDAIYLLYHVFFPSDYVI